jgi:DNA-binding GntR family transcriptional regulator
MAATRRQVAPELGSDTPVSLADATYVRMREEIIRAELPPGALLRDEELTERLGVGRTPVREAIQRLRREGYVTTLPRRGSLVTQISITDLAAIYEIRIRLESWAARLAAERASNEDHLEAQLLVRELQAIPAQGGYEALLATDRRIHRFVFRCARNPYLAETLDHYHNLSLRILHVAMERYPTLTPRLEDVVREQRALLMAICRGDADTAERVAISHISSFERQIREII